MLAYIKGDENSELLLENIVKMFSEQVDKNRNKVAIEFENEKWSYGKLDEISDKLAFELRKNNYVGSRQSKIGVMLPKSPMLIVSILAVWKCGGIYIPIYTGFPIIRKHKIIEEAKIDILITEAGELNRADKLMNENKCIKKCIYVDEIRQIHIVNSSESNRQLWDNVARQHSDEINGSGWIDAFTKKAFTKKQIEQLIENVYYKVKPYLSKNINVLEIGCGKGLIMKKIHKEVNSYHCIDCSKEMIKDIKKWIQGKKVTNVTTQVLDAKDLEKIESEKYDLVIINSVLQYLGNSINLMNILGKVANVLTDNGVVFIGDIKNADLKREYIMNMYKVKNEDILWSKIYTDSELWIARSKIKKVANNLKIKVYDTDKIYSDNNNELVDYRFDCLIEVKGNKDNYFRLINGIFSKKIDCTAWMTNESKEKETYDIGKVAYIMFTSGSTGVPKGIVIGQDNLVNFIYGIKKVCGLSYEDSMLAITHICFDISILELILPITCGMKMIMCTEQEADNPNLLRNVIKEKRPTIVQMTPSKYKQTFMIQRKEKKEFACIKKLLVGGEKLEKYCVQDIQENFSADLYNMYGPTETTVWSTVKKIDNEITIGRPIVNTNIAILDDEDKIVEVGQVGEICIGGFGVSYGYHNNEVLTRRMYIFHPINDKEIIYRTGDLGFINEKGEVECLGRKDFQMKIRGNRVEGEEITNAIKTTCMVSDVELIIKKDNIREYLVALVVVEDNFNAERLTDILKKILPEYMIPAMYIQVNEIPLNANGKADKKKIEKIISDAMTNKDSKYILPENDIQERIFDVWAEILDYDSFGIDDDFFELGGDSLSYFMMITELSDLYDVQFEKVRIDKIKTIRQIEKLIKGSN